MTSQTDIYRRLVSDHADEGPVCVSVDATCGETVRRMSENGASCAVLCEADGRAVGILTEQDVVRRIAYRIEPETPVYELMTLPVLTVDQSDYLFHAIGLMRRRKLRHIPVVDAAGKPVGMLALHRALASLSAPQMKLINRLTHDRTVDGLKKVKQAQIELADALFDDNVPVPEVQALLTEINTDIHRRVVRRMLDEMAAEGLGEPPVAFSLIVMGSSARGENFLLPDQDNGFILADYDDADHDRIDGWFLDLAGRVTKTLDAVGFPLCTGNIMATNPVWRKTISQWRSQVAYWMAKRSNTTLRFSDILFDFAHAYGDADLTRGLQDFIRDAVQRNPGFLKDLYSIEADHKVALGWFGRLMSETDTRDRPGMINLKYGGTLPLVEGVRLLALKHGVSERSTRARMQALGEKGAMDANERDYLLGGLRHITWLMLRQQIADFKAGEPITNFVPEAGLTTREKDYLVNCFRAVDNFRDALGSGISGEIF